MIPQAFTLRGFPRLESLFVENTAVGDAFMSHIAAMPRLKYSGHRGHEGVQCVDKHDMCVSEFGDFLWPKHRTG